MTATTVYTQDLTGPVFDFCLDSVASGGAPADLGTNRFRRSDLGIDVEILVGDPVSGGLQLAGSLAAEVAAGVDWDQREAQAIADLIQRVQDGDPTAIEEWRRRYGDQRFVIEHTITSYVQANGVTTAEDELAYFVFSGSQLLSTDAVGICENSGAECELAFRQLRRDIGIGKPIPSGGGLMSMPPGPLAAVLEAESMYSAVSIQDLLVAAYGCVTTGYAVAQATTPIGVYAAAGTGFAPLAPAVTGTGAAVGCIAGIVLPPSS